jgi:hypothetical protein
MKSGRSIHWESQLERDLVHLLEFDPAVVRYREQPVTVHYDDAGKSRRYTPDFLVEMVHGLHVIEVKPVQYAEEPEWRELFERMAAHFAAEGVKYEVLTEREIRRQPHLDNVTLLLRYQRQIVSDATVSAIRMLVASDRMRLADLAGRVAHFGSGVAGIYALLAQHLLATDLNMPIGPHSPIWVA